MAFRRASCNAVSLFRIKRQVRAISLLIRKKAKTLSLAWRIRVQVTRRGWSIGSDRGLQSSPYVTKERSCCQLKLWGQKKV